MEFEKHVKGYPDCNRWSIEVQLNEYLEYPSGWLIAASPFPDIDNIYKSTHSMKLEEAVKLTPMISKMYKDAPIRIRNLDTGEVVYAAILGF